MSYWLYWKNNAGSGEGAAPRYVILKEYYQMLGRCSGAR